MKRTTKLEVGRLLEVMYDCKGFGDVLTAEGRASSMVALTVGTQVAYVGKSHVRRQECRTNGRFTSYYIRYVQCLTGHGPVWINIKNLKRLKMPKGWVAQAEKFEIPGVVPFDEYRR